VDGGDNVSTETCVLPYSAIVRFLTDCWNGKDGGTEDWQVQNDQQG